MIESQHRHVRWSYASTFSTAAMQLLASATITRFLQPRDYGLAAMAMLSYSLTGYLTQLGMDRAVVQKQNLSEGNIRAAFTMSLATGVVGFAVLALLSPLLARYFQESRLPPIIMAFGLNLVFNSASNVARGLMRRNFQIRELAMCDFVAYALSTFGVGLTMAIKGYGVWALVGSNVSQPFICMVLYYAVRPHALLPTFRREDYRKISSFGGMSSFTTAVEAIGGSIDTIVLGRTVAPATLGLYNRSLTLSTLPAFNVSNGLTRVFYPALARAAERSLDECKKMLLQSQQLLLAMILPMCLGAASAAPTIIPVVFGRQWIFAVPTYQALCIVAFLDASFHLPAIQLEIRNQFKHKIVLQVAFALTFGLAVVVFSRYGITQVALAYGVLQLLRTFGLHALSARSLNFAVVKLFATWIPGALCALTISVPIWMLQSAHVGWLEEHAVVRLLLMVATSAVGAVLFYRSLFNRQVYQPWRALFTRPDKTENVLV
ncbi:MAG: lipopolysaccharide biosynthesis protein [Acidocella sp.]|nr:lipopolysaccharide biosynthesis protein [Acidocella sp.]